MDPDGELIVIQGQLHFYRVFRSPGRMEQISDNAAGAQLAGNSRFVTSDSTACVRLTPTARFPRARVDARLDLWPVLRGEVARCRAV